MQIMKTNYPIPVREKTINFPFEYYHYDKTNEFFVVPFHYHEDQQLFRVIKGSVTISANSHLITLNEGDCSVIDAYAVHACQPCSEDTEYESITFNLRDIYDLSMPHYSIIKMVVTHQLVVQTFFTQDSDKVITDVIEDIFRHVHDDDLCTSIRMIGKLTNLFTLIVERNNYILYDNEVAGRFYKHFTKANNVFRYIFDNYTKDITLEDMSKSVDLSEKYFCKFFKELTSYRPMEYLNKFRTEVAAIELTTTLDSINEVAKRCGFKDPCYFTKLFKRFVGVSPREYRENHPNRLTYAYNNN